MSEPLRCENCGRLLPPGNLGGRCPSCLREQELDTTLLKQPASPHPERVGPYYVINLLGEGGMGIVYLAEQREPMRRRVAVKLMKHGLNSRQVIGRFESERQALALMTHPGVARVFDAGVADDGRPYFVMEYVAGLPITEFCDRRQLSVRDRLKLFVQVCDAIQHAHQKGIIHRDIKPSNVLVTEQEGAPTVKVIDFGVAKAANQLLSQKALFTEHGVMIGTPAYMSPEQTEADGLTVDTRSDIYSLGVLLYELLVGGLPFDAKSLRQAAAAEMLRQIREEEPEKPTTRLERLGETAETVARQRQTDVRSLTRLLKGDMDWITMRALEKNPARRYASASEFAADIQRYFAQEPVVAGPPSFSYRIQKLARRHRVGAAAVLAVFLALVLGVAVSLSFYFRAERHRERVQLEADALEAALRDEPERYLQLARQVIELHRAALGSNSIEFARHLAIHLAISWDFPFMPAERQAWEQEALPIIGRALDEGDPAAVDVLLILGDSVEDPAVSQRLSGKALAVLRRQGKSNPEVVGRLADLFELDGSARSSDAEGERVTREIVQLRRQTLPAGSRKLQASVEKLAELLARNASILAGRGDSTLACADYREARGLLQELGIGTGAFSRARFLELDAQFSPCALTTGEALLKQTFLDLHTTQGIRNSATQTTLKRLIDFYQRQGTPIEISKYRALLPDISLNDVRDLGPLRLGQRTLRFDKAISLQLNQRSTWVVWKGDSPSWGTLDEGELGEGQPVILESSDSSRATFLPLTAEEAAFNAEHSGPGCKTDCGSHWILAPKAGVSDSTRERALLFYSKSLRSMSESERVTERKAGVSVAVWREVEGPAERPVVRAGDGKANDPTLLFGPDEPAWGTAAIAIDSLLYTYACNDTPYQLGMDCLLARAPLDQALERASWQFYTGTHWSQDWRDARPVIQQGRTALFSVHWNKYLGKLVAFCTRSLDHRIQMRVADRPEGPWSEAVLEVEGLRPTIGHGFPWIGVSNGHSELAVDEGRVEYLTYTRTTDVGSEVRMLRIEFAKK